MTIATQKFTLAEYLTYDDGTDTPHELVEGELIPVAPETPRNKRIALLDAPESHHAMIIGSDNENTIPTKGNRIDPTGMTLPKMNLFS